MANTGLIALLTATNNCEFAYLLRESGTTGHTDATGNTSVVLSEDMQTPGTGPWGGLPSGNNAANFAKASFSRIRLGTEAFFEAFLDYNQPFTLLAFVKAESIGQASTVDYAIFSNMNEGGSYPGVEIGIRFDGTNWFYGYMIQDYGSKRRISKADIGSLMTGTDPKSMSGLYMMAAGWDGGGGSGAWTLWLEHVSSGNVSAQSVTTDNAGTLDASVVGETVIPCIGSRDAAGSDFNGLLGCVCGYSTLLSTAQLQLIRDSVKQSNYAATRRILGV